MTPSPRASLVVLCGLSGSGKSHLGRALAERWGSELISSDVVRKELADVPKHGTADDDHYGDGFSRRTYEEMASRARERLGAGERVVVDGTFRRRADREAFEAALGRAEARPLYVRCVVPERVMRERLLDRDNPNVSDATVEVLEQQEFEPWADAEGVREVATDRPTEESITDVEDWIRL